MSSVFRVVKNCNYTTLSNYHFKDKRLSWKAKGLLSTMLSLPDNWNYSIEGLASLSDDGTKATNSGLIELEKCGYLIRRQLRNVNGHFGITEYIIYEQPVEEDDASVKERSEPLDKINDCDSQPLCQNGQTVKNTPFSPYVQKRQTEKRIAEKGVQLNTNILNTKELNTYSSSSSSDEAQNEMRKNFILDEEEIDRQRKRLELERIAKKCSPALTEAVFKELCRRGIEFIRLMNADALEQVCLAVADKQRREPIRMLPNLINTYLDNIMEGIRTFGSGNGGRTPPQGQKRNPFNNFLQNDYDFAAIERDVLKN